MSYQEETQNLYSSGNFVSEKYNPSTSSATGSSSIKHIYRKQDPNYRKQMLSRQRKRRCAQLSESQVAICYISGSKDKTDQKISKSRVSELLVSPRNTNKRQNEIDFPKKKEELSSNEQIKTQGVKRMKSRSKTDKLSQALQIEELRLLKISLNREIRALRQEIQNKDHRIAAMSKKISELNELINKKCEKCQQKIVTINQFAHLIEQQRIIIEQQETALKSSAETNIALPHQDIERLLSDVHKNFQDISISESRLEEQSVIWDEQRYQKIIKNLQQKIKYQQIQIAMMKKYRFDQHQVQVECQKYRAQNKFLFSKIKTLSEQKQKNYGDYSISFDLSREQEGSSIIRNSVCNDAYDA